MTDKPQSQALTAPGHDFEGEIMRIAIQNGAGVETIERLVSLKERVAADYSRRRYFDALAKFQRECPPLPKTKVVRDRSGREMYRYVPLSVVQRIVRPVMHENGLMNTWDVEPQTDGTIKVTCHISHVDGHSVPSHVTIPPTKGVNTNASQDMGIMMEYGRRNSLLNGLGIVADDSLDTDCNVPPASADAIAEARAAIKARGRDEAGACKFLGIARLEDADAHQIERLLATLKRGQRPAPKNDGLEDLM